MYIYNMKHYTEYLSSTCDINNLVDNLVDNFQGF